MTGRIRLADPHGLFLSRIWELRNNVTAHDAVYLALAEALEAPLVTRDAALASVAVHDARVERAVQPRPKVAGCMPRLYARLFRVYTQSQRTEHPA